MKKNNGLTVKWKKQGTQTSGYQVCLSQDARFKKQKRTLSVPGKKNTELWIPGLKDGTAYFVRVRTFKTVKNKTFCSAWSKVRTVKTIQDQNNPYKKSETPDKEELSLVKSNAEIGFQILREKLTEKGGENALISPVSLYEDLAMAANAAGGKTLSELERYLGGNLGGLNEGILHFNKELPPSVHIANSIWINEQFGEPGTAFLNAAKAYYQASVEAVSYSDPETVKKINNWVKQNTKGMIPSLVDRLSPDEVMHLINAVAFEASWKNPYEREDILENSTFTNSEGEKETCVMLQSKEAEYLELTDAKGTLLAQGFLRPYGDGKTAFLALLPKEEFTPQEVLQQMNGSAYQTMYQGKSIYKGGTLYVRIPEFKLEDKTELEKYMQKAGVKEAFQDTADFSGMLKGGQPVHIDSVVQKTFLALDRSGTKAAAATDIAMKANSASPMGNCYLYLNRPFLYMIVDYQSGLPLFIGAENHLK